ncbi:hypothetical protein FZEAL_3821 [Fusarium zealandicum]|uniref:G-protein coupled receptors family 2 profile 2 domain-containing protein n=1 Tax=Fusarium zealandicum TaxID=1053134 RepID=A0A8H4UN11_9HYPO|nr:hypothetical protein FZEAL_3821 [Fusarium zealandicum]
MQGPKPGQALSSEQIDVLITIERVGAGCSMVAIVLVMLSYWAFRKLRTTPNLFLLFAATANAGASVASMIGYDGLQRGEDSDLCQAQAFIFEWFMQSDPWWSFAMSVNVFLVFFFNANPRTFRQYAWLYCVVCFGGPMIPAVVLISIRDDPKGLIFGDAALWCWVGTDWSLVRLYSYYIPIWVCIFSSILIYIAVGYHVFHHRNQLRNMTADQWENGEKSGNTPYSSSEPRCSSEANLTGRQEFYGTAVTEVQITTDVSRRKCQIEPAMPPAVHPGISPTRARSWALPSTYDHLEANHPIRGQRFETVCSSDSAPHPTPTVITKIRAVKSNASLKLKRLDPVKMAYLRTSFIFGFAVLITWIPSSVNRLYSLAHNDKISFPLSVASGCVLPLQGVWNALIYFTTSWKNFCEEVKAAKAKWRGRREEDVGVFRMDSRLGIMKAEHRDTFERARQPRTSMNRQDGDTDED